MFPFVDMTVKGWVWYQGENNMGAVKGSSTHDIGYSCEQRVLVEGWRKIWSEEPGTTLTSWKLMSYFWLSLGDFQRVHTESAFLIVRTTRVGKHRAHIEYFLQVSLRAHFQYLLRILPLFKILDVRTPYDSKL